MRLFPLHLPKTKKGGPNTGPLSKHAIWHFHFESEPVEAALLTVKKPAVLPA
ncbi:hypothetical protein GTCCBUS3UF5_29910 [Geobacillus thermoleovorans CCB_US3_UF5]|uniref:Uncharacterized protein n=1 Tax=Geobacillus thermoleovorans CCB_US3_UF5 TaxID=1111068 RepID=A0ABM5ML41_GEOTH|nr:hypothetical protein GTCCBUS3UF5_29910 [Geobacillus thermoleovorans CCB_US3_UF5]GAJ57957.1 hypothetical protein B23_1163 [Geobacillus thermoleovorans B23]